MADRPAETIRAFLDQNSSWIQVPFHNLLTTWQLQVAGQEERERIARELADAGVDADPSIASLAADDEVTLRVAPPPLDPDPEPPWQAEERRPTPDVGQPLLAGLGRRIPLRLRRAKGSLVPATLVVLGGGAAAVVGHLLGKAL